jgi:hypothetical protein
LESINAINELLISAHSLRRAFLDNILAVFTLQLSPFFLTSHYEKVINQSQVWILVDNFSLAGDATLEASLSISQRRALQSCWVEHTLASECGFFICMCPIGEDFALTYFRTSAARD